MLNFPSIQLPVKTFLKGCLAALSLVSCTGQFEYINRNPNEVTEEQLQAFNYKVGSNLRTLQGLVVPVDEHMYQYVECMVGGPYSGYVGTTVDNWHNKFETFNPPANWRARPFADILSESYPPYRAILSGTDDPVATALAHILRVSIMHKLTDSYGPIPYSRITESNGESLMSPYDSQKEVYTQMFSELDDAISELTQNISLPASTYGRFDAVYSGDILQWLKYANSLKLRMAMRLAYVDPETARTKAAEAISAGVMEDNSDNATFHAPENRMAVIYNVWNDHRAGADIISYMNGYQDPRRSQMFTTVSLVRDGEDIQGYAGIRIGIDVPSRHAATSSYSNIKVTSSDPYLWMNAAEVMFLKAEYELRWGDSANAGALYRQGIRLSFEEKGMEGAEEYLADSESIPEAYSDPLGIFSVSEPASVITVAWEDSDDDLARERNLERIVTQKWIAIFPLGAEAWAEHRRTGYPRLLPVVENHSDGEVSSSEGARRLQYPMEEYYENYVNLLNAIATLTSESSYGHGDYQGTHVWWDCATGDEL